MSNRLFLPLILILLAGGFSYAIYTRDTGFHGDLSIRLEGNTAVMNGLLGDKSEGQVKRFIRKYPQVQTLVLQDMPGTVDLEATLSLSLYVRQMGLDTQLLWNSRIASGAVDLFIAGNRRTIACGAHVGVHAWAFTVGLTGQDLKRNSGHIMHRNQIRHLDAMGLDGQAFYWFTIDSADADSIHIMTVDELNRYKLPTETLVCDQA